MLHGRCKDCHCAHNTQGASTLPYNAADAQSAHELMRVCQRSENNLVADTMIVIVRTPTKKPAGCPATLQT